MLENDSINSNEICNEVQNVEQNNNELSKNAEPNLILGKFKDVEELTNAYKNIQTQHGQQSKELGELRKKTQIYEQEQKNILEKATLYQNANQYLGNIVPQYNKEEYFQNPDFNNLYQEAFKALGTNLDSEKFISLLDKYAQARINLYEKHKIANSENESIKNQMKFNNSDPNYAPSHLPKIDSLSDEEIDQFVAKHI